MKTPQITYPLLAAALGVSEVILKREDLHPYGSHKGRSIPLMMKHYVKEGWQSFSLSSSGNAALAAIHTLLQHNKNNPGKEITLNIYVGEHIDSGKLKRLSEASENNTRIAILQDARPKQRAFQDEAEKKAKNLRQSTDDLALVGYHTLADELQKIEHLSDIFIPTSSGTTAQGLLEAFISREKPIRIHIVQTTACFPLAETFVQELPTKTETSLAGAIVDHVANRKQALTSLLQTHQGSGWIIADEEISTALTLVKQTCNLSLSANGVLGVAGLQKMRKQGLHVEGAAVCIVTGQ